MNKLIIITFLLFFILGCNSITTKELSNISSADTILYETNDENRMLYPSKDINIFKSNKIYAKIILAQDNKTLELHSNDRIIKIWKYYDYSGVDKISFDNNNILRIIHWKSPIAGLFHTRWYLTEINLFSLNSKQYKIKDITKQSS